MLVINAVTANNAGTWMTKAELNSECNSLHVDGVFSANIVVYVSNFPSHESEESLITITAPGMYDFSGRYEWYRFAVEGYVSGAPSAATG